jgi:polar amino acid transport system substrate-binding protein
VIFFLLCIVSVVADQKTFVVGTNAEFPPFSYKEGEKIVGFDIDIAKEVCARLGNKVEFKDMPFEALIPELILGRVDFLAAGMSATEERAQKVLFTQSYLQGDPLACVTLINSSCPFSALKGKTILVNEGYTADMFLSGQQGYQILRLPAPAEAFIALKMGKAQGFITAKSTVDAFLENQPGVDFHIEAIEGTEESCSLVFAKTKEDLLQEIQAVLDAMQKDGTVAKYKAKWKL